MRVPMLLAAVVVVTLLPGCVPYKPTLFLENSPETIPAKVLVLPIQDASPPEDKASFTEHSLSQTSPDSLEDGLSTLVTRAVVADFSATSVFRSTGATERHPDLILSGIIHRFYGEVTLPSWAKIPGVAWAASAFWSPMQERHGEVDLEFTVSTPEGEIIARYRACEKYGEVAGFQRSYWSMPVYPAHLRLNRTFTNTVRRIRDQMLKDRARLLTMSRPVVTAAGSVEAPECEEEPPCEEQDGNAICTDDQQKPRTKNTSSGRGRRR